MERIAFVAAAAVACAGIAGAAHAQAGKLGAYSGTVSVSGSEIEKHSKTDFRATIKVSLPVASRNAGSTRAEADDVDKPSATATITQWELEARNASPDSDGKITSWKCSLVAPTDVPMNASGALDVDHRTKKHSMFVALVSTKPIPLTMRQLALGRLQEDRGREPLLRHQRARPHARERAALCRPRAAGRQVQTRARRVDEGTLRAGGHGVGPAAGKVSSATRASHAGAPSQSTAIKAVALFEAFKGAVVLLAASGLLSLIHRDVHALAAKLIEHSHLNPAARYPRIFLDAASNLHDSRLVWLAVGAGIYALVRFVEAYGLYGEKAWAEVLAAVSGGIYVPFELAGLTRHPTWHGALLLALNLFIVALMVRALLQRRKDGRRNGA